MPQRAKLRRQIVRRDGEDRQQKAPASVPFHARLFDVDKPIAIQIDVEMRARDGFERHRGFMRLAVRFQANRVGHDRDVPQRIFARNVLSGFDCANREIRQRLHDYALAFENRALKPELEIERRVFQAARREFRRQVVFRDGKDRQQKAPARIPLRARFSDVDKPIAVQVNVEARFCDGIERRRARVCVPIRRLGGGARIHDQHYRHAVNLARPNRVFAALGNVKMRQLVPHRYSAPVFLRHDEQICVQIPSARCLAPHYQMLIWIRLQQPLQRVSAREIPIVHRILPGDVSVDEQVEIVGLIRMQANHLNDDRRHSNRRQRAERDTKAPIPARQRGRDPPRAERRQRTQRGVEKEHVPPAVVEGGIQRDYDDHGQDGEGDQQQRETRVRAANRVPPSRRARIDRASRPRDYRNERNGRRRYQNPRRDVMRRFRPPNHVSHEKLWDVERVA